MDSTQTPRLDWSDFSRRKTRAVIATICLPFAFTLPIIISGANGYMPYIAVLIVIAALITDIVFLRQLQLVSCPKCGKGFMNQEANLLIMRSATWFVLFKVKCISCGAHRWLDS